MAGMFVHGAKTDAASTKVFKAQLNKIYSGTQWAFSPS